MVRRDWAAALGIVLPILIGIYAYEKYQEEKGERVGPAPPRTQPPPSKWKPPQPITISPPEKPKPPVTIPIPSKPPAEKPGPQPPETCPECPPSTPGGPQPPSQPKPPTKPQPPTKRPETPETCVTVKLPIVYPRNVCITLWENGRYIGNGCYGPVMGPPVRPPTGGPCPWAPGRAIITVYDAAGNRVGSTNLLRYGKEGNVCYAPWVVIPGVNAPQAGVAVYRFCAPFLSP